MTTKLGLEVLLESQLDLVAGKRVGLVACPSSVDRQLRSSVELLHQHPDVNLAALFGPEHGIRGDAQAGAKVDSTADPLTQLPVHSLYGKTQRPSPDMLRDLDLIIIDLQDGGVRFYTFLATALYVMEAARAAGISVVILDRPAPINGARVEGPMLDPAYASFVGPAPLPIRYGLTLGELARLRNEQDIHCDLTVVPLQNWSRPMWYDQTGLPFIPSSPNLPTLGAMTLYPGTCVVEGTNLSEGRGTTRPFEYYRRALDRSRGAGRAAQRARSGRRSVSPGLLRSDIQQISGPALRRRTCLRQRPRALPAGERHAARPAGAQADLPRPLPVAQTLAAGPAAAGRLALGQRPPAPAH